MIRLPPPPRAYDPLHLTKVQAEIERALRNLAQLNAQVSFGRVDTVQLYIDGVPYAPSTGIVETISAVPGSNLSVDSTDPANPILDFDHDPAFGTVNMTTLVVSGSLTLPANAVTRAALVNGAAKSVIGRSANTSGAVADIAATTARHVLASNSGNTAIAFRALELADLPDGSACSVVGRSANSVGALADIAASGARQFLATNALGTAIGFRAMGAADLPGGNWITSTNGQATRTAVTNVTADATWTDTLLSIALPAAGTYLVTAVVPVHVQASTIEDVYARMFNATTAAAVAGSAAEACRLTAVSVAHINTVTLTNIITVAGANTIRVELYRTTGTYTTCRLEYAAGFNEPRMSYVRIA